MKTEKKRNFCFLLMVMELLKLSKFKLQLQSLISEVRYLRDRERSATEQHRQQIQRQKQNEEELTMKIQELQQELASVKEERQKLERQVNYLQNDNAMLESKHKELKGTLNSVLQSRENFVHAYEALQYEVGSLQHILQRIQDTIMNTNEEDKMLFSSILSQKEASTTDLKATNNRMEDIVPGKEEKAHEPTEC
ncbi:Transmembrane protein, putative [Arachis hypogaea]|nr:Transmembrane protein, putative [Arachis hypogaea]